MRNLILLVLLFTSFICKADSWTRKADFPDSARRGPYGFAIGNKAYVGGGFTVTNLKQDLWEYDPSTNAWSAKASLPTPGRAYAISFSIGNKGYVCGGAVGNSVYLNDLWEYDPATDTWTQKANCPGGIQFAFVIGGKAYIGGGMAAVAGGLCVYDPAANTWDSLSALPVTMYSASAFSVDNKGYVTGFRDDTGVNRGVFEYTPSTNTWAYKALAPAPFRSDATAFTIGNIGYFGIGDPSQLNVPLVKDWWQFNQHTSSWIPKASIPCADGKDENVSFVIANKGYMCFGGENLNTELWEYTPDSVSDVHELNAQLIQTKISPNPFTTTTTISFTQELQNAEMILSDISGREIEKYKNINGTEFILHRNNLASGVYFYQLNENGLTIAKDKIIVQ